MIVTEKAPAKLNLSLDTPMRYFDGFPQWDMVMVSADLADYVTVETHRRPATIKVYTNSGFLPNDQRNLAYQAAHILRSRFHRKDGVTIKIKKQIPVAAGLGGGSSDAAAVLRALNNIWRLGLSLAELAQIALTIDSDVPYCVYNKLAHVTGHGEKIELLPSQPHYWAVIAKQQISVSTPQILRQIDYEKIKHLNNTELIQNLKDQNWLEAVKYMGNVLEPLTMERYPEIGRLKDKMKNLGADVAQMSGTGPTVFAICHTESRAKRIQNSIRGFCRDVHIVTLL
ncbi:4-(cytidine 5'-diphospho)-2-C-methyl-D-erythritol kinase [Lactobacillus sp. 0.1XD8-4]|uniref:4-diphosphocytidyl-2-C-methyl-D-erythritol kinase n=1 Tax=Limosilactobacillus walteri TaxID=2268022 RepID=A0ABR8P5J4_9LACO|nr:4-(cytidine 5'-diphospho)-2-C-methyl-D-erythritol kinase [Limosilactobacillus walteri]MBD5805633.1 4-(cytidine 5'-diphospho)-2-C-methyl-D-erythritol kinase [Limosilactobacillus walteri]MRN06955.1 4-(cytidine 5'-diphospho)-2-C-methyl-D-erythritol kinase [Lactobacillus sp. 0.1XD8-4]